MNKELIRKVNKILISGNKEDLNKCLESFSFDEQKDILINLLASSSFTMLEPMFDNVKTRPLLYHLISDAERRGKVENKEVYITYADQRKLGKISSTYGMDIGDEAIVTFVNSLHKGLEGIKKSNYDIIRMGGDEFCIITIGENREVVEEYLKKAKTIANNTQILFDGKPIKYKVDFTYGTSKLDYSDGRTLRQIIDEAKNGEYYQLKLSEAEEIADAKTSVLIDVEKQTEKIKTIENYIKSVTEIKKCNEQYKFEIITKSSKDVQGRKAYKKNINTAFVIKLAKIAEATGLKREALIEELYDYDLDVLKDNFISYGENFIREGKENFIKQRSLDLLLSTCDFSSSTKIKYVEVDNLKLVNSARTHKEGDNYLADFAKIINDSMKDAKDPSKESYAVRMSGNTLIIIYDECNECIFDSISEKASKYKNPDIIIPMDVYTADINCSSFDIKEITESYLTMNERVQDVKSIKNRNKQKLISSEDGYEIFYQREVFGMDEVDAICDSKLIGYEEAVDAIMELVPTYGYKTLDLIRNELIQDLDENSVEAIENKIAIELLKKEIAYQLERDEDETLSSENLEQ